MSERTDILNAFGTRVAFFHAKILSKVSFLKKKLVDEKALHF